MKALCVCVCLLSRCMDECRRLEETVGELVVAVVVVVVVVERVRE